MLQGAALKKQELVLDLFESGHGAECTLDRCGMYELLLAWLPYQVARLGYTVSRIHIYTLCPDCADLVVDRLGLVHATECPIYFGMRSHRNGRRGNAARNTTRNASTGTGFSNAPARGFTHFNTHALA